jgi:Flp pilus assembly protein TadG
MAMIEFALGLPLILAMALGGLEVTNLALAHLRVSQIGLTVADNAARVPTQMDETDIRELFTGASVSGQSLNIATNGRIVLSSLEDNGRTGAQQGQTIAWQRCFGQLNVAPRYGRQGAGANDATLRNGMGDVGQQITSQTGTAVMFVEVTYDYQPLISNALLGTIRIRYETALNVRERTALGITNTTPIPVYNCPA